MGGRNVMGGVDWVEDLELKPSVEEYLAGRKLKEYLV